MIRLFKILGLPKDTEFNQLAFGRQIEWFRKIEEFKLRARHQWISIKRATSSKKEIKQFIKSIGATEYYVKYYDDSERRDDSVEIYYI